MTDTARTLVVGMMQTPPYDRMFEQSRRVYSAQGISPTLHTQGGGIERLRYWWSCKNVHSISPTTPIFAHITDMIRMRLTSFSFVSSGDKQKQHFIYDTTSALGRLHSHTHYRRAASWQHTGVHPQAPEDKPLDGEADALVYSLWVGERHRGRGVAKLLMETAERELKRCGIATVAISWDGRDSPQWVLQWYERLGYVEKAFDYKCCTLLKRL